jgi:FAD/FMN-containing dehydrogenase
MTDLLDALRDVVGAANVMTGPDFGRWGRDWMGDYDFRPLAVLRPASTAEVSGVMRIAHAAGMPVVPVSGNTGLAGGAVADGVLMLSVDRLNRIREIRPGSRMAIVEAGVILDTLSAAAEAHDLLFPMTFGARGSAMIGGILSTNAGGSNVLRYGNTRDLCMGIEVVLADGRVMDLMSQLHKDNSGLNLRHLMIGAEGTLGVITAAVMKLAPRPRAHATAMLALPRLADAIALLNRLQEVTGGAVSAFEYMPGKATWTSIWPRSPARPPRSMRRTTSTSCSTSGSPPRATPHRWRTGRCRS